MASTEQPRGTDHSEIRACIEPGRLRPAKRGPLGNQDTFPVIVHSVARHLGISDEQAQDAIRAAGHRLKRAGDPPHPVAAD
jgi:hypothetical protein